VHTHGHTAPNVYTPGKIQNETPLIMRVSGFANGECLEFLVERGAIQTLPMFPNSLEGKSEPPDDAVCELSRDGDFPGCQDVINHFSRRASSLGAHERIDRGNQGVTRDRPRKQPLLRMELFCPSAD
jgi:hypothetical protein